VSNFGTKFEVQLQQLLETTKKRRSGKLPSRGWYIVGSRGRGWVAYSPTGSRVGPFGTKSEALKATRARR
jgi:hypothetical protein